MRTQKRQVLAHSLSRRTQAQGSCTQQRVTQQTCKTERCLGAAWRAVVPSEKCAIKNWQEATRDPDGKYEAEPGEAILTGVLVSGFHAPRLQRCRHCRTLRRTCRANPIQRAAGSG